MRPRRLKGERPTACCKALSSDPHLNKLFSYFTHNGLATARVGETFR